MRSLANSRVLRERRPQKPPGEWPKAAEEPLRSGPKAMKGMELRRASGAAPGARGSYDTPLFAWHCVSLSSLAAAKRASAGALWARERPKTRGMPVRLAATPLFEAPKAYFEGFFRTRWPFWTSLDLFGVFRAMFCRKTGLEASILGRVGPCWTTWDTENVALPPEIMGFTAYHTSVVLGDRELFFDGAGIVEADAFWSHEWCHGSSGQHCEVVELGPSEPAGRRMPRSSWVFIGFHCLLRIEKAANGVGSSEGIPPPPPQTYEQYVAAYGAYGAPVPGIKVSMTYT